MLLTVRYFLTCKLDCRNMSEKQRDDRICGCVRDIYKRNNDLIQAWYCCNLKLNSLLLSTCYLYLLMYIKSLLEASIEIEKAVKQATREKNKSPNASLLKSVLLYEVGETGRAILAFRKAFQYKNESEQDVFYNKDSSVKQELYERKVSGAGLFFVSEKVLEPGFQEGNLKKKKKKKITIDEIFQRISNLKKEIIESDLTKSRFDSYLTLLESIEPKLKEKNELYKQNTYELLLEHTGWLLDRGIVNSHRLLYIHGLCYANLSLLKYQYIDVFEVFKIFNLGLAAETSGQEETKNKISEYKNFILSLAAIIPFSSTKEKGDLLVSSKSKLKDFEYEAKGKIDEVKYLCLGDIYMEMQEYRESITCYLKASSFLENSTGNSNPYLTSKYSRKLAKIFNEIELSQMVAFSKDAIKEEYQKDSDLHDNSENLFYSRLWLGIGKELYQSGNKRNKSGSKSTVEYQEAVKAYSEALEKAPKREKARVLLARGRALIKCEDIKCATRDFEKALAMDGTTESIFEPNHRLTAHNFRIAVQELSKVKCGRYSKRVNIRIGTFLDNIRENYKLQVEAIRRSLRHDAYAEKLLDLCKRKLAEAFYVEGEFNYYAYVYQDKRQSQKSRNLRKTLERSFNAYASAIRIVDESFNVRQGLRYVDLDVQYFMLETIVKLIETGYRLNKYSKTQEYLKKGSELLQQLLIAEGEGKLTGRYRYIQRANLRDKFDVIEEFRISFFEKEETALGQAEVRKNIFLNRILKKIGRKENQYDFSYKRIREILSPNTAVLYWYVGLSEVSSFILTQKRYEPINTNKGKFDKSRYFDEGKYKKYKLFKEAIKAWNALLHSQVEKSTEDFHSEIEQLLNDFFELLNIQSVLKELQAIDGIKNIIIVPHRDLHRIPMQVFFNSEAFRDGADARFYNISYLPSVELGLQLDDRSVPESGTLSVHPTGNLKADLLSSYAESASIYLRSMNRSSDVSILIEGNSEEKIKATKLSIRNGIDFSFLHFLGHARHDFKNPANSALELSRKERLTLGHILKYLDFSNYYMVCLSACETGVTSPTGLLDEYVGLASAFLAKGVNYIVSSLWKIEDVSSTFLMIEFYRLINDSKNPVHPVLALGAAQTWLREASRVELSQWCKQQTSELERCLDSLSLDDESYRKIQTAIALIEDYSYTMLNIPEPYPFSRPYYWAGFTITGLPSTG